MGAFLCSQLYGVLHGVQVIKKETRKPGLKNNKALQSLCREEGKTEQVSSDAEMQCKYLKSDVE